MQQGNGDLLFGELRFFIHKTCFRKFCQKTHLMDGPFLGDEVRPDQAMIHRGEGITAHREGGLIAVSSGVKLKLR